MCAANAEVANPPGSRPNPQSSVMRVLIRIARDTLLAGGIPNRSHSGDRPYSGFPLPPGFEP